MARSLSLVSVAVLTALCWFSVGLLAGAETSARIAGELSEFLPSIV